MGRQRIEHDRPLESRRSGGRLRSGHERRVGAHFPRDVDVGDTANPATSTEFRVNSTGQGIQESPSVAMTPTGAYIVAWSGKGNGGLPGRLFQDLQIADRYRRPDRFRLAQRGRKPLEGRRNPYDFARRRSPWCSTRRCTTTRPHTGNAVTNPANYTLTKDGTQRSRGHQERHVSVESGDEQV